MTEPSKKEVRKSLPLHSNDFQWRALLSQKKYHPIPNEKTAKQIGEILDKGLISLVKHHFSINKAAIKENYPDIYILQLERSFLCCSGDRAKTIDYYQRRIPDVHNHGIKL